MDHILLLSEEEGLKCFNSWILTDTEKNDPDHIWKDSNNKSNLNTIFVSLVCTSKVTDSKIVSQ